MLLELTFRIVHAEPPEILNYSSGFSTFDPGSLAVSAPEFPAQVNCFAVLACLSSFGPSDLPCVLLSLTNSGRVVYFSFC